MNKRYHSDPGDIPKIFQVIMSKEKAELLEATSFFLAISQAEIVRRGMDMWLKENPIGTDLLNKYKKVSDAKKEMVEMARREKETAKNEPQLLPRV